MDYYEFYSFSYSRPKRCLSAAIRRSSELVSYVVSERVVDEKEAESFLEKHGLNITGKIKEFDYWGKIQPLFRALLAPIVAASTASLFVFRQYLL